MNGHPKTPGNPTPLDVTRSAVFGPAVLSAVQDPRLSSYLLDHSVPSMSLDIPLVTEFPVAPGDRMEVNYIADETNGVVWRFVYRAATAKWHYIGGPSLWDEVDTQESETSLTYDNMATVGPSVTVPLNGDYKVEFGANFYQVTGSLGYISPSVNGAAALDADAIAQSSTATGIPGSRQRVKTITDATSPIILKYRVTGNSMTAESRWLQVTPITVSR